MAVRSTEIAAKPFQHSKACTAANSTLVQPFILAGGATLSRAGSLVYHRRHIGGMGRLPRLERETPRRRGRNAITAALNLFEVHCATGGGVNGNATSSTSTDFPPPSLVLLPRNRPPPLELPPRRLCCSVVPFSPPLALRRPHNTRSCWRAASTGWTGEFLTPRLGGGRQTKCQL